MGLGLVVSVVAARLFRWSRPAFAGCLVVCVWLPAAAQPVSVDGLEVQALAPRSTASGGTLFTRLTPEETGIETENPYDDPRMWNERYRELAFGALGTGVAVGDFDNDGRPDIFIVSKTRQSRLFRNLGNWKFEDVTEKAGLAAGAPGMKARIRGWFGLDANPAVDPSEWKQGASFVDVNNDGLLDLYVCRFAAPNLLYINLGDGRFREEGEARGLAVSDASGMGAFHDFDRDGWLDLYLQTNMLDFTASPGGQRDYLFRNRGDGTFEDVTEAAGISGSTAGHSATWWDFDNDGWPDIYVANDFATPDTLYRNNRDGTFTDVLNEVVPHTPYYSMGADLGDVNNDGWIDLLVADMAATTHEKDQRSMAGSRARGQMEPGDARTAPQYMRNVLFLNTNAGVVLEAAQMAGVDATDWTWSPRFEDFDNDGRIDLHVTNGMIREFHGSDLLEKIMVSEDPAAPVRIMRESPVLQEANLAFRNVGDLTFEDVGESWGLDQNGVSFGSATGDFDGDGDLDLVFANLDAPATILRNDGTEGNRLVIALRGTTSNRFGVGAVVRVETGSGVQVRQLVLARGNLSSSEPILHFGLGEEDRISRLSVTWPGGQVQTFRDLPANRRLIITEPASRGRNLDDRSPAEETGRQFVEVAAAIGFHFTAEERDIDEITRQPLLPVRLNPRGPSLAVGDLNADGRDDIVIGGTNLDRPRAFLGQEDGRFSSGPQFLDLEPDALNDGPVLIGDFDGDGRSDLLRTRAGVALPAGSPAYRPGMMTGRSGFNGFEALADLAISVGAAAAADFDRDGDLDLFLGARVEPGRYPKAPPSALLTNEGGQFRDVTSAAAPMLEGMGMVTSALWSDVDGDGWIDLLVAVEWGGIVFLRNRNGTGFVDESSAFGFSSAGKGLWTSLAAADFNGDGRVDYVVGNLGLNTPYRASEEEPALLCLVKPGSSDAFRMVEAYFEDGIPYPRRTRAELAGEFRWVRRQFPRNSDFASADLESIMGRERLAASDQYQATELRSGVFLSQPGGGFEFNALPRLAQISAIQGLVAGDFDGDGKADILALHNSHAPVRVVGRFDGGVGVLLRGDGSGGFSPVPAEASGFIVTGHAQGLAVIDFNGDGWPDMVVTRNRGRALAFENRGIPGRRSFAIRLAGPAGNPTAIGARVSVVSGGGAVATGEVQAGSGLMSQSSSSLFFGYEEGDPPHRIRVRWPSGAESEHPYPSEATEVRLAPPGG